MGCDIHSYAERKVGDKYEIITGETFCDGREPFSWRAYGVFGFLANVRNYSDVTPIAERRGWPADASEGANEVYEEWAGDAHSASWLAVAELASFDYDQPMEDRRVSRQISENLWSGAETAEAGGGRMTTFRDFLGAGFFHDLKTLQDIGADRILFFFDN